MLNASAHCGLSTELESLEKLEDYRHADFVGEGSYRQVFKHESRRSAEVFAVKVVAFFKTTRAGREENDKIMIESFVRKIAYIHWEADILGKADHVSSFDKAKSTSAKRLASDSYFAHTKSSAIQTDWHS